MWMVDAVRCERWDHTASLLCQAANTYRDPKSRPLPFERFHPYRDAPQRSRGMSVSDLHAFRGLFREQVVTLN
jgi:hypothetical protein